MGIIILLATLILLLVLRVRVAFALLLASLSYSVFVGIPLPIIATRILASSQSFPLLAIPLFIFAGNLMAQTGMTQRLFRFAEVIFGRMHGGLGQVVVAVGMVLSGTSGSAIADAAALSRIAIPEMERLGYPRGFSTSICAFAATMGPLIPPSIMFIIFGWLSGTSINSLFIAGAIPGLLVGVFMFVVIYIIARRNGYGVQNTRPSINKIIRTFAESIWAIAMPIIVLGGIVIGAFTATEAAAIAVAYAAIVGLSIYRTLGSRELVESIQETVKTTASIMLVIAAAYPFAWILTAEQVPQELLGIVTSWSLTPALVLLLINIILIFFGMLMETTSILLIVIPTLLPIVQALGVDPVHFGVIVTANLLLGAITPPFGVLMFVTCAIGKISTLEFQRQSIPFYIAYFILLMLITYIPAISLWLPHTLLN